MAKNYIDVAKIIYVYGSITQNNTAVEELINITTLSFGADDCSYNRALFYIMVYQESSIAV